MAEEMSGVVLPELCTIDQVVALQAELIAANSGAPPYLLDARQVQRVDSAGLQLLLAFARTVGARHLQWEGVPAALHAEAHALGLLEALGIVEGGAR